MLRYSKAEEVAMAVVDELRARLLEDVVNCCYLVVGPPAGQARESLLLALGEALASVSLLPYLVEPAVASPLLLPLAVEMQ